MLKNGKISVDKSIVTTYAVYTYAVLVNGEDPSDPRFAEILERLAWQDQTPDADPFFTRHMIKIKRAGLETFEANLMQQVRDMWDAREDPVKRYPTFPWQGCGDCDYRDVCHAIQFKEDVDNVIEPSYTVGTYGTMESLKDLEPQSVTDVESLITAIAAKRKA